jgi:hypothetical protein
MAVINNLGLGDLDGEAFTHTTIKLTNAGDGLSDSMRVEPCWLKTGDEVFVIVKAHVSQVTGKPWVGKGGETGLERIVTLKAEAAGLAAEDLVGPVIAEMQVRLRELRDAEAGQGSLADRMGDNVTPVKPEEGSE